MLRTWTKIIVEKNMEISSEKFGITKQSKNMLKHIGTNLKNVVYGENKTYTELLEDSRKLVDKRLIENAEQIDTGAVIMMRLDSGSIDADMLSVPIYGTIMKYIEGGKKWIRCLFEKDQI